MSDIKQTLQAAMNIEGAAPGFFAVYIGCAPEKVDEARSGDHIWYISDNSRFQQHYPGWKQAYDIDMILEDMYAGIKQRLD